VTEILSMNSAIHAAVRRDLDRLEAALRVVADGDRERVAQLVRAWEFLDAELVDHHEKEDELVWPVLEQLGVDHTLLAEMESEHVAMREALEKTGETMTTLARSAKAADASAVAESIVTTRAVVDRHLTHEEHEVEPLMLQHKDSPEWKRVEKQLRSGGPVKGGRFFAWLLDDASPEADRYLRSTVQGPVLLLLTRVFGAGYQRQIAPVWRT
jgi:hemerythrin-like domain-containing protein